MTSPSASLRFTVDCLSLSLSTIHRQSPLPQPLRDSPATVNLTTIEGFQQMKLFSSAIFSKGLVPLERDQVPLMTEMKFLNFEETSSDGSTLNVGYNMDAIANVLLALEN